MDLRLALLALAVVAGTTGCATVPVGQAAERAVMDSLYGTWNWVQPRAYDGWTRGQLILNADATYSFIEYGGHLQGGKFATYQAASQDSLYPWIELERDLTKEQWVFQFIGRDTLLLREGDAGYAVSGSEVNLFVRAPLGNPPSSDQHYDEAPLPLTQVQPRYPEFAREAQIQGKVVMQVLVGEDGRVREAKVLRGVKGLNEAAVAAVKKWTFKPAAKDGVPVAGWLEVPMDFHF
jgi:TonB family protein